MACTHSKECVELPTTANQEDRSCRTTSRSKRESTSSLRILDVVRKEVNDVVIERMNLVEQILTCERCELHEGCISPVPFSGTPRNKVAVLGQNPGCMPAGTPVFTPTGPCKIEEIKIGDVVYGGDGELSKVLDITTGSSDELIEIKIVGEWKTYFTPNHPVWAVQLIPPTPPNHNRRSLGDEKWIPAGELSTNFAVSIPWLKSVEGEQEYKIDLSLYNLDRSGYKSGEIPNEVVYDEELAFLFGFYMADGSANLTNGSIQWSLSEGYKEKHIETICDTLQRRFNLTPSIRENGKRRDIQVYSRKLVKFFLENFGKDCYTKRVPVFVFQGSVPLQSKFLFGWYEGDGNHPTQFSKNNFKGPRKICTVSKFAAWQCAQMYLYLGIYPELRQEKVSKRGKFLVI